MGQKITVKIKKFWRKKSGAKALPEENKETLWQRIKNFFKK